MNTEGTIAQCKFLILRGKQVTPEKVDSLVAAASTFAAKIFSDYAVIELPKQYKREKNANKQAVRKYGRDQNPNSA